VTLAQTPQHLLILKISEGCDRPCCSVQFRWWRGGRFQYRWKTSSTGAVIGLKDQEIILLRKTDLLGLDIYGKRNLSGCWKIYVEGIEWSVCIMPFFRFPIGYSDVMNERKNIEDLDMRCNILLTTCWRVSGETPPGKKPLFLSIHSQPGSGIANRTHWCRLSGKQKKIWEMKRWWAQPVSTDFVF